MIRRFGADVNHQEDPGHVLVARRAIVFVWQRYLARSLRSAPSPLEASAATIASAAADV
jgi:hypothetical protein